MNAGALKKLVGLSSGSSTGGFHWWVHWKHFKHEAKALISNWNIHLFPASLEKLEHAKSEKCLPIRHHIRNTVCPYLYRAAVEVVPQICMAGVVFVLLQAIQHCLFKKIKLWPCTALRRQRAQLLHTRVQTHKIPLHLLQSDRMAKPNQEDLIRQTKLL